MSFADVGSPKNNNTIGGRFCDMFEQIAMAELLPYAKKHKLTAQQLWVWTDVSRVADQDDGLDPQDCHSPMLTVLFFEQPATVSNLEAEATRLAKPTGVVGQAQIYQFGRRSSGLHGFLWQKGAHLH